MDVMTLRRGLMMAKTKASELYPIGTNLYDGLLFQGGTAIDTNTGDVIQHSTQAASDFIEVSELYEYTRSYRLYGVFNYDANHNYLGYQSGVNNLGQSVISAFIPGTKYIRTIVLNGYLNDSGYIGNNNCWLKRTA